MSLGVGSVLRGKHFWLISNVSPLGPSGPKLELSIDRIYVVNGLKCKAGLLVWVRNWTGPCEFTVSVAVVCLRNILWALWTLDVHCSFGAC